MNLTDQRCTPCRGGIPPLTREQAQAHLVMTPGWLLNADATAIHSTFKQSDFAASMAFVNAVGKLAEEEGHHPTITFGWGFCAIEMRTTKINGLHANDFIMAAKINALTR